MSLSGEPFALFDDETVVQPNDASQIYNQPDGATYTNGNAFAIRLGINGFQPDYYIPGCTDTTANNYNPIASTEDYSCQFGIYGCTDAAAGNYDPNAECDNGCCDNASPNVVSEEVSKLSIYPNPVKKILTIDGDYTSATIYDLFGKLVLTTNYQKTIDVATLSNGIYFIKTDNKMTKFIKQ